MIFISKRHYNNLKNLKILRPKVSKILRSLLNMFLYKKLPNYTMAPKQNNFILNIGSQPFTCFKRLQFQTTEDMCQCGYEDSFVAREMCRNFKKYIFFFLKVCIKQGSSTSVLVSFIVLANEDIAWNTQLTSVFLPHNQCRGVKQKDNLK